MLGELTKCADGDGFEDKDGLYHEDRESFLCSRLNFCGCGSPEDALSFVRSSLRIVSDLKAKVWEKTETWESWDARCNALFGSDGCRYFTFYFLDHHELTEHGGAVPGWLTDKGKELLADLDSLSA